MHPCVFNYLADSLRQRALSIYALPLYCHDRTTLGLGLWHLARCGRILSNWHTMTLIAERRVRVLQNRYRYWVSLVGDFKLSPFYRSFLEACPFPLILRRLTVLFGISPLSNGFGTLWWLFSATVLIDSIASPLNLLMKVSPLAASKRYLSCRPKLS